MEHPRLGKGDKNGLREGGGAEGESVGPCRGGLRQVEGVRATHRGT